MLYPRMISIKTALIFMAILGCDREKIDDSSLTNQKSLGATVDPEEKTIKSTHGTIGQEDPAVVVTELENVDLAPDDLVDSSKQEAESEISSPVDEVIKPGAYIEPQPIDDNIDAHTRTLFRWPDNLATLKVGESLTGQIRLALDLRNHCIIDDLRMTSAGSVERNWLRFAECDPAFRIEAFKTAPNVMTIKKFDSLHFKIMNIDGNCATKQNGAASFFMTFVPCDDTNLDQLLGFVLDSSLPDYGKIKVNSDSISCFFAETDDSSANDINADPEVQGLLISNIQVRSCDP